MPDATPAADKKPEDKSAPSETKPAPATKKARKARKALSKKKPAARRPRRRKPGRPPSKTLDVASLRQRLALSRPALAKLLGVHENSIANWERGSTAITEKNAAKLREVASGKRIPPAAKRKPGRPPKAESDGAIDVAALRSRLSLSRAALAKRLGAVPESVRLWEHGTKPSEKFTAKLRALAGKKAAPAARVPTRARGGARPGRRVAIVGEVPVVYADAVSVVREGERARIRFGMRVPGERGARCVADVVVSGEVMRRIGT